MILTIQLSGYADTDLLKSLDERAEAFGLTRDQVAELALIHNLLPPWVGANLARQFGLNKEEVEV